MADRDLPELAAFDFTLPEASIAQEPTPERDAARLLVLDRARPGELAHRHVRDLPSILVPGDLLVLNATKVLPARLRGTKDTGGLAEALLLGPDTAAGPSDPAPQRWRALVRCRGRLRIGQKLRFGPPDAPLHAEIAALRDEGEVVLALGNAASPYAFGETPLPPYIRRSAPRPGDAERYQSVFARVPGSVAAPTASLHLGERVLGALEAAGVARAEIVLHVGPGTFRPLGAANFASGRLHAEPFALPPETANAVARTRARGGRVVAVGTTVARALESCAREDRTVEARSGETDLFVRPGHGFRAVDALLTNFHLPRSSLLLLVAAFAGRDALLAAYARAIAAGYRFYSYGDCMLVL